MPVARELSIIDALPRPRIESIPRTKHESSTEHIDTMPPAQDKTTVPNWALTTFCGVLLLLLGFVYTTVDRRIEDKQREMDKLEIRVAQQETYMKNTREKLIANGWQVDEAGNINPPPKHK